jgi:hypothetical protein
MTQFDYLVETARLCRGQKSSRSALPAAGHVTGQSIVGAGWASQQYARRSPDNEQAIKTLLLVVPVAPTPQGVSVQAGPLEREAFAPELAAFWLLVQQ